MTDVDGFISSENVDTTIIIDHTAITDTDNYKFARIELSGGSHYVVETRKQIGNYESNLPGTAIIIHHVKTPRSQPAWVVDKDVPPANFSDNEGVMWKVGEIFIDPIDGYSVEVLAETTDGFQIHIKSQMQDDLIFIDGFD